MAIKWHHILPQTRWADRLHATFRFRKRLGRWPDPKRMLWNDQLFKVKVSDEILDPLRVFVSDKEYVKVFVRAVVGDAYNVPTLAILHSIDEVANFQASEPCCIKPTHLSGQVMFCDAGERPNLDTVRGWFKRNYYLASREANYRHLTPKVIVEPLLFGSRQATDYKFFCVDAEARVIMVDSDVLGDNKRALLDRDWNDLACSLKYAKLEPPPKSPENYQEMRNLAERLASQFQGLVRVDLYSDGEQIFVGEITNSSGSGAVKFIPEEGEKHVSDVLFGAGNGNRTRN